MLHIKDQNEDIPILDEDLWERLIELTDGAAVLCYQCGVCTATCPWGQVRQSPLSVRNFMRQAQTGLLNGAESLWLCTTCAQCEALCPRGVNISAVFRAMRAIAWERRSIATGLPAVLWSVYWNNNPWSQPPSQRSAWAKGLDVAIYNPELHEVLLYVGCTSSYDRRAQGIARSLVRLLQAAGVSFGTLGEHEPCCGEAVLSLGHWPYFQEIAASTAVIFRERGVRQLVAISPHCYDVFKNHYPEITRDFQPWHYTQYLAQLVEAGRLEFDQPVNRKVTFQDPCYLGRHNDEFAAPRRLLKALLGAELVEMPASGREGLCCGGGGGRMWLETAPGERFSDLRVAQAIQTGAQVLATACPFCAVCLEDSVKAQPTTVLTVYDIAELALQGLSLPENAH